MDDALAWAAAPASEPAPSEPVVGAQAVADVGARTLCALLPGWDYTSLDAATRAHLQEAVWQAFVAMWDAAVEQDLTVAAEHVDADGQPLTQAQEPTP